MGGLQSGAQHEPGAGFAGRLDGRDWAEGGQGDHLGRSSGTVRITGKMISPLRFSARASVKPQTTRRTRKRLFLVFSPIAHARPFVGDMSRLLQALLRPGVAPDRVAVARQGGRGLGLERKSQNDEKAAYGHLWGSWRIP
jgi:hypothetical protein